jgi:hypothetical protein
MKSNEPILTTLSYSGGVQSHVILEMILRGDYPKPENFLVLNADPGMEDNRSYAFVDLAKQKCKEAGIDFITAKGGNLYEDLLTFRQCGKTRLDNPPYWTKNRVTGKKGRLRQTCTQAYKIAPMRRALRQYLQDKFGISVKSKRIPKVRTFIGFAYDEQHRCKQSDVKYVELAFPLIERGMCRDMIEGYYRHNNIPKPPRSVCVACFANGLNHFRDMYMNRYEDWEKAVAVDEAIRDMRPLGIEDECFVSPTLVPLKDLPKMNFKQSDADFLQYRCNSGVCFL